MKYIILLLISVSAKAQDSSAQWLLNRIAVVEDSLRLIQGQNEGLKAVKTCYEIRETKTAYADTLKTGEIDSVFETSSTCDSCDFGAGTVFRQQIKGPDTVKWKPYYRPKKKKKVMYYAGRGSGGTDYDLTTDNSGIFKRFIGMIPDKKPDSPLVGQEYKDNLGMHVWGGTRWYNCDKDNYETDSAGHRLADGIIQKQIPDTGDSQITVTNGGTGPGYILRCAPKEKFYLTKLAFFIYGVIIGMVVIITCVYIQVRL